MIEGRILVAGGSGRLGRAVLAALGARGLPGVRRHGIVAGAIKITASGRVNPAELTGVSAIVNCTGQVTGSVGEIEQANIVYPTVLAQIARAAGVPRFVQVSSFSVFGRAEEIDAATCIAPVSAYGASKLAAEHSLQALNSDDFQVITLRLPFMFSAEEPALLGRLVSMMLQSRLLPTIAERPCRRSMITYPNAAQTLIGLATAGMAPVGVLAAADPEPLELLAVARLIGERFRRRIAVVRTPEAVVSIAGKVFPSFADRLFRSSVLMPSANLLTDAGGYGVEATLIRYLDSLAGGVSAGQHH